VTAANAYDQRRPITPADAESRHVGQTRFGRALGFGTPRGVVVRSLVQRGGV